MHDNVTPLYAVGAPCKVEEVTITAGANTSYVLRRSASPDFDGEYLLTVTRERAEFDALGNDIVTSEIVDTPADGGLPLDLVARMWVVGLGGEPAAA